MLRQLSSRLNRAPSSELSVHDVAEDEEEGEVVGVVLLLAELRMVPERAREPAWETAAAEPAIRADHGIPVSLCVCKLSRHCGCARQ